MKNSQYNIRISGSAHYLYPAITVYGYFWYTNEEALDVPPNYPHQGTWGEPLSNLLLLREGYPMPFQLNTIWLSLVEKQFYYAGISLPTQKMEELWMQTDKENGEPVFQHIIAGMAPYGKIAVWIHGNRKSEFIGWYNGNKTETDIRELIPNQPDLTLTSYCDSYLSSNQPAMDNLHKNGLPPRDLFDNYMKQFTYRYQVTFGQWDEEEMEWKAASTPEATQQYEFNYIEEALFDGTHDKLHDGGLMNYHQAGKPKKLSVQWHIKKSEYTAYFWFEDEEIRRVFERFYGAHPETKTDFMIRIDSEKKKFELALYRYGLKEPQVISESAYQLLVFKNKFEFYRSDNYNQAKGAWIW